MNRFHEIKKTTVFCVVTALILSAALLLYSCEKPDILELIENIFDSTNADRQYYFDADLSIKTNKDYLDELELDFKINGKVKGNQFEINIALIQIDDESQNFETTIYRQGDILGFRLNDFSKIILDFLCLTGFVDMPVKNLFELETEDDSEPMLYFDLKDFDLDFFGKYIDNINNIFTVKSSVNYDNQKDVDLVEDKLKQESGFNFSDIKNNIEKELLKLPYYRYEELYIVLETDESGENFINILATRENGERNLLERMKIDCDLTKARQSTPLVFVENIIPMRYVLELLGETVVWVDETKQAFMVNKAKNGELEFFDGTIINSRIYVNLAHFMARTRYVIHSVVTGEYIEFKLSRN